MANAQISEKVKDKFKMRGNNAAGVYFFKGAKIDTTTVDLDTLEKAVANGFDIVIEVKAKKADADKK